jgi:hypothetical protein
MPVRKTHGGPDARPRRAAEILSACAAATVCRERGQKPDQMRNVVPCLPGSDAIILLSCAGRDSQRDTETHKGERGKAAGLSFVRARNGNSGGHVARGVLGTLG